MLKDPSKFITAYKLRPGIYAVLYCYYYYCVDLIVVMHIDDHDTHGLTQSLYT